MKEMMQKTLIFAAIMILIVFSVSMLSVGATPEILLVLELFLLSFLVTLVQHVLKKLLGANFMFNLFAEYVCVCVIVLLYGCLVRWFFASNWWMVFVYVAIIYIPAYLLDMAIVKRDVDFINTQLEERRRKNERRMEEKGCKDKSVDKERG